MFRGAGQCLEVVEECSEVVKECLEEVEECLEVLELEVYPMTTCISFELYICIGIGPMV